MQRYTEAFDVEGTKKKIRNFVRKVVREHPEMLERWNELMDSDIDTHDDYGEVQLIQDMFKPYGGRREMSFEKETNSFSFIIPLFTRNLYPDYDDRREVEKEIGEVAKEFFGTEDIKAGSEEVWRDKYCFAVKVSFGNSYMTPKRILQTVLKKRLSVLGTPSTVIDSFIVEHQGRETLQIPSKVAIYTNKSYDGEPVHTLVQYTFIADSNGNSGLEYIENGDKYSFYYEKGDTSDKLYNEYLKYIENKNKSNDNGGYY